MYISGTICCGVCRNITLSSPFTEVREHLFFSFFFPFRSSTRQRERDTAETKHKGKQAAAICLQLKTLREGEDPATISLICIFN